MKLRRQKTPTPLPRRTTPQAIEDSLVAVVGEIVAMAQPDDISRVTMEVIPGRGVYIGMSVPQPQVRRVLAARLGLTTHTAGPIIEAFSGPVHGVWVTIHGRVRPDVRADTSAFFTAAGQGADDGQLEQDLCMALPTIAPVPGSVRFRELAASMARHPSSRRTTPSDTAGN